MTTVDLLASGKLVLHSPESDTHPSKGQCYFTLDDIGESEPWIRCSGLPVSVGAVDQLLAALDSVPSDGNEIEPLGSLLLYCPDDTRPEPYIEKPYGSDCPVCGEEPSIDSEVVCLSLPDATRPFLHGECVPAFKRGLERVWEHTDDLLPAFV